MNKFEVLAMLLDKRTVGATRLSREQREEAIEIFESEYVKFYRTANTFDIARLAEEKEKADAATLAGGDVDPRWHLATHTRRQHVATMTMTTLRRGRSTWK
uniref:Uncharacterized protein n=1 Tax=Coccolithus braarudii TaxID=221442 RepID=A0A7S0LA33_9EUKA|mmetsp:Transcript_23595/g.50839  ORF Transcript_23595/g.50839 Transcript_23595/m.50839 type:complete len:101 (+) Transcript_23595:479-781(+)